MKPHSLLSGKSIDEILAQRKILISCGTGGVGKTTVSAAIAVRAALQGKRVVVVTIDPAKRLATSLGMEKLGNDPTDLTPRVRAAWEKARSRGASVPAEFTGKLAAIMPDTRKTFEDFVHDLSPNPSVADRVMRNPIFQIFAKEFSGTNEYMALEKLLSLDRMAEFDCIVLDTPPSRNTLAFLEAPKLLARLFEEKLIKWMLVPANRLFSAGMKIAMNLLEKLTGSGFMTHLVEFASALFEVQAGFTKNLSQVTALLESEKVGFLVVATPSPGTGPEIRHFIEAVNSHRFHFEGVAMNRTMSYLHTVQPADGSDNQGMKDALRLVHAIQEREQKVIAEIIGEKIPVCSLLPELARDVHSVEDLFHVALALDHNRHAG